MILSMEDSGLFFDNSYDWRFEPKMESVAVERELRVFKIEDDGRLELILFGWWPKSGFDCKSSFVFRFSQILIIPQIIAAATRVMLKPTSM